MTLTKSDVARVKLKIMALQNDYEFLGNELAELGEKRIMCKIQIEALSKLLEDSKNA